MYLGFNLFGYKLRVATIDTMLSFYLAFIYSDRPYYDDDRILCMAHKLFLVQEKNRLKQKGLLKRFSLKCYGNQVTLESNRTKKSEMYKQLQNKRNTKEYEEWFLKYSPASKKTPKTRKKRASKRKANNKANRKTNRKAKSHLFFKL